MESSQPGRVSRTQTAAPPTPYLLLDSSVLEREQQFECICPGEPVGPGGNKIQFLRVQKLRRFCHKQLKRSGIGRASAGRGDAHLRAPLWEPEAERSQGSLMQKPRVRTSRLRVLLSSCPVHPQLRLQAMDVPLGDKTCLKG